MRVQEILTGIENGEYATSGRDFGRGMAYAASLLRPEIDALVARRTMTLYPGTDDWRANREKGWHLDVGYQLQDVLRDHHYDTSNRASKPDDPGWHACTCGWEGYWSGFEPHVADHLRAVVTQVIATVETTSTAGDEQHGSADPDVSPVPDLRG